MTSDRRVLAIVLGLIAACAFAAAALSPTWFGSTPGLEADLHIGLRGAQACAASAGCESETIAEIAAHGSLSSVVPTFASIALIASLVAAASLLLAALLAAARRAPAWPIAPTTVALLALVAAMITGCVFGVMLLRGSVGIGVGWGFLTFGGGVIAGIPACLLLARVLRPADASASQDAMHPDDF